MFFFFPLKENHEILVIFLKKIYNYSLVYLYKGRPLCEQFLDRYFSGDPVISRRNVHGS